MGIPYIQLESDFIRSRAPRIAAILKIHRHMVVGMASDLFGHAVSETSTEERPPDGNVIDPDAAAIIEAWMEWSGEPGLAVDAFMRAGVLTKLEIGIHIKGMERYSRTWEKNKRRKPAEMVPVTGKKPAKTGTETESKTEMKMKNPLPSEVDSKHPATPKKLLEPVARLQKPAAQRETWKFQEFQQWAQFIRQKGGFVPEDPIPIYEGERWWLVVTDWTGGAVEPICAAFLKFGQDKYWESADPPFPLRAFLRQWDKFMRAKEAYAHG